MFKNIRKYENFHIFLWLLKDMCWVQSFKLGGVIMIGPTILAAIHITWLSRKSQVDLLHNLAITSWITANSIWMVGEFYFNDTTRPFATIFFVLGLLPVAYYYGYVVLIKGGEKSVES